MTQATAAVHSQSPHGIQQLQPIARPLCSVASSRIARGQGQSKSESGTGETLEEYYEVQQEKSIFTDRTQRIHQFGTYAVFSCYL